MKVHRLIAGTADVQVLCGDPAAWPDLVTSRGLPTCPACIALLEPTTGTTMPRKTKPKPAPATEPEVLNQDSVQQDEAQSARVADANARIDKTLGEHVADAEGRVQKIPWKHDIGSSVLLLTEGQPPRKAVIRNIADQGAFAHYDLNLGADGGTVDGVEAWRIGRDLDAEGELAQLRDHLALLQRHNDRAKELAQKHVEMEAEERRLAEVLSTHRKSMHECAAKLAQHVRSDPGQTDLRDVVGEAEYPAGEGKPAAGAIATRVAAGDVIELADLPFGFDALRSARLDATASTGKPQRIVPAAINGADFVLADVQDGVAVLLPVLTEKEWFGGPPFEKYGPAKDLPSDDVERLAAGGKLNGCPVKVGRSTRYIGDEASALLVRLPADLAGAGDDEVLFSGKDAAAGA
jgi:hypothetical protein